MRTILCLSLLAFACGDNGGSNPDLSMSLPHDMAAPPGSDLACDNTQPTASMCGHKCDKGNSIGIGKYCEGPLTGDPNCPSTAPICAHAQMMSVYFCTTPCFACTTGTCADPTDCKEGAVCQCDAAAGGCGCVPSACTTPSG
jgi:hypothetical protein